MSHIETTALHALHALSGLVVPPAPAKSNVTRHPKMHVHRSSARIKFTLHSGALPLSAHRYQRQEGLELIRSILPRHDCWQIRHGRTSLVLSQKNDSTSEQYRIKYIFLSNLFSNYDIAPTETTGSVSLPSLHEPGALLFVIAFKSSIPQNLLLASVKKFTEKNSRLNDRVHGRRRQCVRSGGRHKARRGPDSVCFSRRMQLVIRQNHSAT
jgi:hypothetical protein